MQWFLEAGYSFLAVYTSPPLSQLFFMCLLCVLTLKGLCFSDLKWLNFCIQLIFSKGTQSCQVFIVKYQPWHLSTVPTPSTRELISLIHSFAKKLLAPTHDVVGSCTLHLFFFSKKWVKGAYRDTYYIVKQDKKMKDLAKGKWNEGLTKLVNDTEPVKPCTLPRGRPSTLAIAGGAAQV